MAYLPQFSTLLQPDFKPDNSTSIHQAQASEPKPFIGMVNTGDAAVECRYKGTFNALGGIDLYNRRLEANLALIRGKVVVMPGGIAGVRKLLIGARTLMRN